MLQADGIGLHRVGVYLSLVDKPALGAPQGPVRQYAGSPCATGIWDNEAGLLREAVNRAFVDRATDASPLNRRERYRTLCHRWMPERCGDRSSMPTQHCDSLINIAHFPNFY